ncbi:MAG: hypothetical protein ABI939_01730 [Anaerolineaceae bacterium]
MELTLIRGISHLALNVANLVEAERYYCGLFALDVAFRDAQHHGRQASLRPGVTWESAAAEGVTPGLSSLWRDGFSLALEQGDAVQRIDKLNHLGLDVDESELAAVKARLPLHDCTTVAERSDLLVFEDRHGLRWELTTQLPRGAAASTGARLGEWLDL